MSTDWIYKVDEVLLDRGLWMSERGEVQLQRPVMEYAAFVTLGGKRFRVGKETYVSAEVAMGVVDRTWKREKEKLCKNA